MYIRVNHGEVKTHTPTNEKTSKSQHLYENAATVSQGNITMGKGSNESVHTGRDHKKKK